MRQIAVIVILILLLFTSLAGDLFAEEEVAGETHLKGTIGDITIKGNFPFVERKISRYLTIRPGEIYDPSKLPEQIQRIKEFYAREGFVDTEVTISEEWEEDKGDILLIVNITHGIQFRYGKIEIEGNTVFPDGRFVSILNTYRTFNTRSLREAIRKMAEIYRMHGYPKARVKLEETVEDIENKKVHLKIGVEEGPYVETKFIGNKHLSNHALKKAITIYREGAYDDYELDASKEEIKKAYKKSGFPYTVVDYRRNDLSPQHTELTFDINEGIRQRIRSIEFTGNERFGGGKLRKQLLTKEVSFFHRGVFDEKTLDLDLKRLKKFYGGYGYLDAEVGEPSVATEEEWHQLKIAIPINEDGQTIIEDIQFVGNHSFRAKRLQKALELRPGDPLNENILEQEKETLLLFYAENGYPYASATETIDIDPNTKKAIMRYTIDEGAFVKIRSITVQGNNLTSQKATLHSMSIGPGEPFSYKKIMDSQIGLRKLGAFRSVKIEMLGLETKESEVDLLVKVEENKPLKLDFELGYSTDMKLTGTLDFANINTFGWGKKSGLRLTGGSRLSRSELYWIDPRFTGHDLEFNVNGWLQYENKSVFRYVQAAGGLGLYRRYHRTGFFGRWEIDRNYLLEGDSTAADAESLRDNTISKTILSMSFDTRNNFANPTSGLITMGTTNFYNEIRGRHANFVKLSWLLGFYKTFFDFMTLSSEFRFDNIQTFGKNISVPTNELLLLGGDDTIRGYDQNCLGPRDANGNATGGRLRWIVNEELRFKLFKGLQAAIFYDMGSLTNDYSSVNTATIRNSIGLGLRYATPIGPIRLEYGFKIDKAPNESVGRLHFTFGYFF